MKKFLVFIFSSYLAIAAPGAGDPALAPASGPAAPPLILISLDAFRWDYCALHPAETPHLRQLAREGISARGLIPVFPSNTFPNHYSIVTGLYPSHHGIVNNEFFDPALGAYFYHNRAASVADGRWFGGEPIWNTAVKQGRKSAVSFWVGSEAAVGGVRPTFWRNYDVPVTFEQRLDQIAGWLRLPAAQRPALILCYIEEANSVGHKYGPDSPELVAILKVLDSRIGALLDRVAAEGITPNVVVVSDHGMTPISTQRIVLLDDYLDPQSVQVEFDGPAAGLMLAQGTDLDAVLRALGPLQHAKAYRTADLPARFHVSANPRNPAVWVVPDEGWEVYFRSHFDLYKLKFNKGDHGFDPAFATMRGILIAHGPAFKTGGTVLPEVENVNIYNLLCAVLRLHPAPNDGDDRLVRAMLK